jgi:Xaa-Pro dipeptidase
VNDVLYFENLNEWISNSLLNETIVSTAAKIHLMSGINSDSGTKIEPPSFEGDIEFWKNDQICVSELYYLLSLCRVTKLPEEIAIMTYCSNISSYAHVEVMRNSKKCEFEFELEARFLFEIYAKGGCRNVAYTSICGCGPNGAVLHYGHAGAPNDRQISNTDMVFFYFFFK